MIVIRRKSDKVALYLFADGTHYELNERGLHTLKFRALDIHPSTHEAVEGATAPEDDGLVWCGGAVAFNGSWTVTNQDAYDARLAEIAEQERQAKIDRLAAHRYDREVAGITLQSGAVVRTSREAQAQLTGAVGAVEAGLVTNVSWKLATGWVTLDAAQIRAFQQAVVKHVQSCFEAEREVFEAIDQHDDVAAAFDAAYAAKMNP